ncbi:MAG: glucosamine-6-phosphate deaminase [Anaeromicrobium sp.]|jgi:glucosamine-6-phosphate deaminase|uniref:glucosamine-6-phosphate deaminase n=1 Tax=Anaeromicrobium sp. TaxID=1929132 RepID=UPI002600CE9E|nr:glucosamine-6-phosphate deaminase [Anaeromicrobium sp.]MCT4592803.1 glucosamine-6-phosphate deaminase [Anaeromicrobium sp.]
MRIICVNNYDEMSEKAANILASQIILKPESVVGLATGSTPIGMYDHMVRAYESGKISFQRVTTFNLDEYFNLDKNNPQSYYFYMKKNLYDKVDIPNENINIPNGMVEDIERECIRYEKEIRNKGGIDIQVLGIGRNGHIGFNEPDIKFEALTHMVNLDEQTIRDNSRFFSSIEEVPTKAISMGIKTIMRAKKIVLLASGKEKAESIYEAIYGKITPTLPASVLQLHPDVVFVLDKDAAWKLDSKELDKEYL